LNTPSRKARTLLQTLARGDDEVGTIYARNVSEALYLGLQYLEQEGVWINSRSGRVIEAPNPVMSIYKRPEERVLFYPSRDANPFFHLFESLWMLAGKNDVKYVSQFNSHISSFSDDGISFHGAYGHRWREYFSKDQLNLITEHLKKEPNSRRAVLQMWSPEDLLKATDNPSCKDVPCNTQVYFKIRKERLQMTVSCRSNDIIWGTYGANAVHFSVLQEYIAARVGVPMGTYYHLSDSYHAYEEVYKKVLDVLEQKNSEDVLWYDSYLGWNQGMHYTPEPMFTAPEHIDRDVEKFIDKPLIHFYENSFFEETAVPMLLAWQSFKQKRYDEGFTRLERVKALDWKKASIEWLERRRKKWELKEK